MLGARYWRSPDFRWAVALLAATLLIIAIAPIGFVGGGWDDWQYLNAAHCWREYGPCLPQDHWQGRWPVIAPLAAITALLGESRLTVSLWPLATSLACLVLLAKIGNRMIGPPVGWIASLLLLATPAFSILLLTPSVEAVELALVLAGFATALAWKEQRSGHWPVISGLLFSLAIQVRETALVAAAFAAIFTMVTHPRPRIREILLAATGFALPFLVEFLTFYLSAGDPLWRRRLSIAHTQIPSVDLRGPIDRAQSPFFNKAYIANWHLEPGLHVHWAIDGLLNLFVNGAAGFALPLVAVLLAWARKTVGRGDRRTALWLWVGAIAYAAVLIYAFAVIPKPRMMIVPLALANVALALLTWRLLASGQSALVYTIWTFAAAVALAILWVHPRTGRIEPSAASWIAQLPAKIEIDPNTRRHLALVPAAAQLPQLGSNKEYLLYVSATACARWLASTHLVKGSLEIVRERSLSAVDAIAPGKAGSLCLLRYRRPLSEEEMVRTIERSRIDGPYIMAPRPTVGVSKR